MIKFENQTQKIEEKFLNIASQSWEQFKKRTDLGFHQLVDRPHLWQQAQDLGSELRTKFNSMVIVGIGGSSLGPRVLADIFMQANATHQLHFCDNVDALEFEKVIHSLADLQKTVWVVISKSGSTIETLVTTDYINEVYKSKGLKFQENLVVISEPKSNPLTDLAKKWNRPVLEIPIDVGGRFSVLTPVGMLPAAFLGASVQGFKSGAQAALNNPKLVQLLSAQTLQSYAEEKWITLFWFYSSWLKSFGGWTQQLWAESLGKKESRKGGPSLRASTPMAAVGACDQHSVLQQVMEGAKDKFVFFHRVEAAEKGPWVLKETLFPHQNFFIGKTMGQLLGAEAQATAKALATNQVHSLTLLLPDLSPSTVGELFMVWQLVVGVLGESLDIDAFNQPGVELGKRLAKDILQTN